MLTSCVVQKEIEEFIDELRNCLANSTFVKLTLSNYKGSEEHLQKVLVRPIETKKGTRLLFQYRYDTRDVAKNYDHNEAVDRVRALLDNGFHSGHLFTTQNDFQLTIGKKSSRLTTGKSTFKTKAGVSHDREKKTLIDQNAFYLKALGIATDEGKIRSDQRDKWKQINKFVEILAGLVENSSLKDKSDLRIVDMGSGKGYLTFAAYDYLVSTGSGSDRGTSSGGNASVNERASGSVPPAVAGGAVSARDASVNERAEMQKPARSKGETKVEMIGVEQRPELVDLCNDIAKAGEFDGLNFVEGTIADFDPGEVDILIALHACDTATDDALFKGITANAEIIVAAPCCHKEIRKQMKPPELLAGILKHGIMLERTAETVTDGLRSLLLERSGYATKLFEFVSTEHTPKNNMIVGTRTAKTQENIDEQIQLIKEFYGIKEQRLEQLLR